MVFIPKYFFFLLFLLIIDLVKVSAKETTISESDIPEWNYLNQSIDPCNDFYQFTCGNFKNVHPRPTTNTPISDHFILLQNNLIKIGNEILNSSKMDNDLIALKKAKALYNSCMDLNVSSSPNEIFVPELITIQEYGGMPLINSSIPANFSWKQIGDMVGRYGVPLIFNYGIKQLNQNEIYIGISNDPLLNPTMLLPKKYENIIEESFREHAKRSKRDTTIQPFDIFLRTLSRKLLKIANPNKTDEEMVEDLDDMANFMRTLYAGGNKEGFNKNITLPDIPTLEELNQWSFQQFGEKIIDWVSYLNQIFKKAGLQITSKTKLYLGINLETIYGVLNLMKQTDEKIVKNFAFLRIFLYQAPDSDLETRKAFENYYQAKNLPLYPRWEYCTRKILDVVDTAGLDYAVAYAYQLYYFNINKIQETINLTQNLLDTFKTFINNLNWMDLESKLMAIEKINKMLALTAYPEFVQDNNYNDLDQFYENLEVCEWDNYGNARNLRAFRQAYQFSQIALNSTRQFWGKSVFDVNAYYNRPNNKMVIPISMLNPPFFTGGENILLDYSRLGSIIGHEMTHGFDYNGKNYNPDGLLQNWWSENTQKIFMEQAQCFVNQYDNYYVEEIGKNIGGSQTFNENLADFGGVRLAYKTFKKYIEENNNLISLSEYNLDQLFFIGYGTMWCSDESIDYLTNLLSTQEHSPNRFRVQGPLSNLMEFAQAFNCPQETNMNPIDKCAMW